jgi:hypothetical protein
MFGQFQESCYVSGAQTADNAHFELDDSIAPFDVAEIEGTGFGQPRPARARHPLEDDDDSHILGMMLNTVLQMLSLERATCVVHLETIANRGQIILNQGVIVDARTGLISGDEAARQMMRWSEPKITVTRKTVEAPRTVTAPLNQLVLQSARESGPNTSPDPVQPPPSQTLPRAHVHSAEAVTGPLIQPLTDAERAITDQVAGVPGVWSAFLLPANGTALHGYLAGDNAFLDGLSLIAELAQKQVQLVSRTSGTECFQEMLLGSRGWTILVSGLATGRLLVTLQDRTGQVTALRAAIRRAEEAIAAH